MNHQIPHYNQNIPIINHTDWASMAKQWATLRANVNIPPSVQKVENYHYHNIPPPPPPPPPVSSTNISAPKPNSISYNNDFKPALQQELMNPYNTVNSNRNLHSNNIANTVYEPAPQIHHSIYPEIAPKVVVNHLQQQQQQTCETFDYNHRDRPFANYQGGGGGGGGFGRPGSATGHLGQPIFNLPPPTHQDYRDQLQTHQTVPAGKAGAFGADLAPQKLFPIDVGASGGPCLLLPIGDAVGKYETVTHGGPRQTDVVGGAQFGAGGARVSKGLPAWIIDDMKKIKEKERKQPFVGQMDDFRDHPPVNSKRDEEGDIVMEDENKESEMDGLLSGKSVITTNRIDNMATEIDIDDVNLNDEDDGFDKIDYSSKSLIDLIELLDETELESLKIAIIRDSLTGVMKQVTDDMIFELADTTFNTELSIINNKTKVVKGVPRDSKTVNYISDATVKSIDPPSTDIQIQATSHLLGLDIYESDDENNVVDESLDTVKEIDNKKQTSSENRQKWSSHKKSSETKSIKKSSHSNKDYLKSQPKEKKISPSETNGNRNRNSPSKIKKRSKSRETVRKRSRSRDRDRHRSPEYRRRSRSRDRNRSPSHKKSKKINHSPDWRESKWKNDKCERTTASSDNKKRNKHDRSRS